MKAAKTTTHVVSLGMYRPFGWGFRVFRPEIIRLYDTTIYAICRGRGGGRGKELIQNLCFKVRTWDGVY